MLQSHREAGQQQLSTVKGTQDLSGCKDDREALWFEVDSIPSNIGVEVLQVRGWRPYLHPAFPLLCLFPVQEYWLLGRLSRGGQRHKSQYQKQESQDVTAVVLQWHAVVS